jgi:hypothetical protein
MKKPNKLEDKVREIVKQIGYNARDNFATIETHKVYIEEAVQKIVALIEEEKDKVDWKKTNKLINKAMKIWEQSTDKPLEEKCTNHVYEIYEGQQLRKTNKCIVCGAPKRPEQPEWEKEFDKRFSSIEGVANGAMIFSDEGKIPVDDEGSQLGAIKDFIRQEKQRSYEDALSDYFLAIADLAEPDERQPSAGDLHTNMDDIFDIKNKLLKTK